MALSKQKKSDLVNRIKQKLQDSQSVVIAGMNGVTVSQMDELRKTGNSQDVQFMVVKNSLAKKAVADTEFDATADYFKEPRVLCFSRDVPSAGARILEEFVKKNKDKASIIAFWLAGKVYSGEHISKLSSLPTREEALTKIAILLNQPQTKLAVSLQSIYGKLAIALKAVEEKKQVA